MNHGCTRQSANPQYIAKNILNCEFTADVPNEKWLTDVTEFHYYLGTEKHKVYLSAILDLYDKISMFTKGMTTGNIESHIKELYNIDISDSTNSRITDKILPIVKEWQEHLLEEVYVVVIMDAIHYHIRSKGRIVKRTVYIALGIDMDSRKDVLGMYV